MKTKKVVAWMKETECVDNDTLIVAEWFACKKFREAGRSFYDNRVFAIIGETEKAYNVVLGDAFKHITTWCPKSLVSVNETPNDDDVTYVCDFATAMYIIREEESYWR